MVWNGLDCSGVWWRWRVYATRIGFANSDNFPSIGISIQSVDIVTGNAGQEITVDLVLNLKTLSSIDSENQLEQLVKQVEYVLHLDFKLAGLARINLKRIHIYSRLGVITMYKLFDNGIKRSDGCIIPAVLGNRDWQKYQLWLAEGNLPEPEFTPEEEKENSSQSVTNQYKIIRDKSVLALTVIVDTLTFDANERSQLRMATRIASMTMIETARWKLHDNSWALVTGSQLKKVLKLAAEETTKIWES